MEQEKEPQTPEEIATHNLDVIRKMRDSGMSAAVIHAVFQKDGIDVPLDFITEVTKPGVLEGLSKNSLPKPNPEQ